MPDGQVAQALLADVWPAEVTLPDARVLRRARVFVTDYGVHVVVQGEGGIPQVVYAERHTSEPVIPPRNAPRSTVHSITTDDGTVTARRLGCVCGSTLGPVTLDAVLRGEYRRADA